LLNPYNLIDHPKGKQFNCPSGQYCLYITDVSETFNNQPVYTFGFEIIIEGEKQYAIDERISHTICKSPYHSKCTSQSMQSVPVILTKL